MQHLWGLCVDVGPSGDHPSPNSPFFCHPKRNYVFQRRYVRFDGKNLMYFSSEKVRGGRMRAGGGCTVLPKQERLRAGSFSLGKAQNKPEKARSEHLKDFCAVRVTQNWHRLPREAVKSPPLESPVHTLDVVLGNLPEQGLEQGDPEVPASLCDPVAQRQLPQPLVHLLQGVGTAPASPGQSCRVPTPRGPAWPCVCGTKGRGPMRGPRAAAIAGGLQPARSCPLPAFGTGVPSEAGAGVPGHSRVTPLGSAFRSPTPRV